MAQKSTLIYRADCQWLILPFLKFEGITQNVNSGFTVVVTIIAIKVSN